MKLKQLLETYLFSIYKNKGHVYINPSPKEMMKAAEELGFSKPEGSIIRFFADNKTKKLYVWNPNIWHDYFFKQSEKFLESGLKKEYGISGIAQFVNRKWSYVYNKSDNIKSINDYKWLDKYFSFTPIIKQNKK